MSKLTEKFEQIIKENIYGYECKKCSGGGANGQDKCSPCNGTGIVDWNIALGIKKLIQAVKERDTNIKLELYDILNYYEIDGSEIRDGMAHIGSDEAGVITDKLKDIQEQSL